MALRELDELGEALVVPLAVLDLVVELDAVAVSIVVADEE